MEVHIDGHGSGNIGALINSNTGAASMCSAPVTLEGHSSIGGPGDLKLIGPLSASDDYTLFKVGLGTLTITGENTFDDVTEIEAGTLQLGDSTINGSVNGDIINYSKLVFGNKYAQTFGHVISGTGTLRKIAVGILTLTAQNTYTGETFVDNGILRLGDEGVLDTTASIRVRWKQDETDRGGTLDLWGHSTGGNVPLYIDGAGAQTTLTPATFKEYGALINTIPPPPVPDPLPDPPPPPYIAPTITGPVTVGSQSDLDESVIGGEGGITITGLLTVLNPNAPRAYTLNKICTGTLMIQGSQSWAIGSVFSFGRAYGLGAVYKNLGTQDDGNGTAWGGSSTTSNVEANLTLAVSAPDPEDETVFGLNATGPGNARLQDCHTLENLVVDPESLGTAQIVLGQGDPWKLGVGHQGGSVMVQLYIAGTEPGADPRSAENRPALEALWQAICSGFYGQGNGNGITTDVPALNNPDNGLAMLVKTDSYGAGYVVISTDIKGDITYWGLFGERRVNASDLNVLLGFKDKPQRWTDETTGITYNLYTWLEGDLDGDGLVTADDLDILINNLSKVYEPGP